MPTDSADYRVRVARLAERIQDQRSANANDLVECFFNTPIPRKLWHYTTISGLEGILASGKIWATEVRHTTDKTEFVHARDILLEYVRGLKPNTEIEHATFSSCHSLIEQGFEVGNFSQQEAQVFIASFSEAPDLKSQWLGYGDKGQGVSIAFDLRRVRPAKEHKVAVTLARCIYDLQQAKDLLAEALGHFVRAALRQYNNFGDTNWLSQKQRAIIRLTNHRRMEMMGVRPDLPKEYCPCRTSCL